jgi:hypothetical protein
MARAIEVLAGIGELGEVEISPVDIFADPAAERREQQVRGD